MVTIILVVALIVSNVGWLFYIDRRDKRERNERWELQERIRQPQAPSVPPPIVDSPPKSLKNTLKEPTPIDEFELVGRVDPPTPLRGNE